MVWQFIESTNIALTDPLVMLWRSFVNLLPGLIAALLLLLIGYVIAFFLGHALKVILDKLGLDRWIAKARLTKAIGNVHISSIFGEITKWYVFVIFL